MDEELAILTERQREIYILRGKGMSFTRIAKEKGISTSAVSKCFQIATKKLEKFRQYQEQQKRNDIPIKITVTRREVLLIAEGLELLDAVSKQRIRGNTVCEERFPTPYENHFIETLIKRIKIILDREA